MVLLVALKRVHKYRAKRVDCCAQCDLQHEFGSAVAWAGKCLACGHDKAIRFPSKAEAIRWCFLRRQEKAGAIRDLERQPKFPLLVNGIKCGSYAADFRYFDVMAGEVVTEDTKGVETETFRLKKKLVEAQYNIKVRVIKK